MEQQHWRLKWGGEGGLSGHQSPNILAHLSVQVQSWEHKALGQAGHWYTAVRPLTFARHGGSSGAFRFSPTLMGGGFAVGLLPVGELV